MALPLALVGTAKAALGKAAVTKASGLALKKAAAGGLKKKAIGAAKGMAKDKAIDLVTGRGKKDKNETQKIAAGGGRGALVKAQTKSVTPMLPPSEDTSTGGGASGAIVSKPSEGGKISFGGINKQIDSIVSLTSSLKTAFENQTKQKEDQQKALRKQLEKKRKAARESLLETSKDTEEKPDLKPQEKKKKGFLETFMGFFNNIIMGILVVGFLKLSAFAKKVFGRGSAAMEAIFWGIRSLFLMPKLLGNIIKGLRSLLSVSVQAILKPFKALKDTVLTALKTAGSKIGTFVTNTVGKAIQFAKDIAANALKAASNGLKAAGKWLSELPGVGKAYQKASKFVSGSVQTVKNIGGKVGSTIKNLPGARKVTSAVKGISTVGGKVSSAVSGTVKGISTVGGKVSSAVSGGVKAVTGTASKLSSTASSLTQTASKTAGKASGLITKLFPGLTKVLAKAAPIFKVMSKAAKGIKIPVLGPLMVAISSLLDPTQPMEQTVYKTMGAGIGGALGFAIPIPVLGPMIGEMAGEFVGDLAYSLFAGGGMEEVKAKAKKKFEDIIKSGTDIKEFISGGFSRFLETFKKDNTRFGVTNWLAILNLGKTFPLLKESFFPPKGEGKKAKLPEPNPDEKKVSKDADSVSRQTSYESGENVIVMGGETSGGSSGGGVGGSTGSGGGGPQLIPVDPRAVVNSYSKNNTLGRLYQS